MKIFSKNKTKDRKAFTLIEILVVLFILILSITLTLASFKDTKPIDEVEAAARGIAALIREAQNSSLTGRQQLVDGNLEGVCNNGVKFSDLGRDVAVFSDFVHKSGTPPSCSSGVVTNEKSTTFKNIDMVSGVGSRIYFNIPSGRIEFDPLIGVATSLRIQIRSVVSPSVEASVCVYTSGRIQEVIGSGACPSS